MPKEAFFPTTPGTESGNTCQTSFIAQSIWRISHTSAVHRLVVVRQPDSVVFEAKERRRLQLVPSLNLRLHRSLAAFGFESLIVPRKNPNTRLPSGPHFVLASFKEAHNMAVAQEMESPKWRRGVRRGPKPAVCPCCFILSHTKYQRWRSRFRNLAFAINRD